MIYMIKLILRKVDRSHAAAAASAKSLQSCLTLCDPIDGRQSTRLPRPWDSPGKNTGVDCHFPLQYMKVKSESEAAQLCPTLSDPMDCSLAGSSVLRIFQARVLEWGAIAFSRGHVNQPQKQYLRKVNCSATQCVHVLSRFNHAQLLDTPWTVAFQAPLSMGLSRQEY